MRAALDEAEKALSPMNEHMNTCMSMMNMMQNMQGIKGRGMLDNRVNRRLRTRRNNKKKELCQLAARCELSDW